MRRGWEVAASAAMVLAWLGWQALQFAPARTWVVKVESQALRVEVTIGLEDVN